MTLTAYQVARRRIGTRERAGDRDDPFIVWCLSLVGYPDAHDEVPWCAAFVAGIAELLGLSRSRSAAARSWLTVGLPVRFEDARVGEDIVVLARGSNPAAGHVGFFAGFNEDETRVRVLGGNQGDAVSVADFPTRDVLGIRRLVSEAVDAPVRAAATGTGETSSRPAIA